jgi:hypothetical protein
LQGSSANLLGGAVTMFQSLIENLQGHLLHPSPHVSKAVCGRILGSHMETTAQNTLQYRQAIFLHPGQIVGRSPPGGCVGRLKLLAEFPKKPYRRFLLLPF